MKRTCIYLILLTIVIFFRYIQELEKYRSISADERVSFRYLIVKRPQISGNSCKIQQGYIEATVKNCGEVAKTPLGTLLLINGSVESVSDSKKTTRIIRLVQSNIDFKNNLYSGYLYVNFLLETLSSISGEIQKNISKFLPSLHASLAKGMLLGGQDKLDPEFSEKVKISGLQHVISASGYNVSLLIDVFQVFLLRFTRGKTAFFCTIAVLLCYMTISGFTASLIRAVLMVVISGMKRVFFHRQSSPLANLTQVGAVMLFFSPFYLEEISFQLSFAATLGLILAEKNIFMKYLKEIGEKKLQNKQSTSQSDSLKKTVRSLIYQVLTVLFEGFLLTMAAQLFTLPIIAWHFGELNLLSFITNPTLGVLPSVIPLATLFYLFSMLLFPFSGPFIAFFVWFPTQLFILGVDLLSKVTYFNISLPTHWVLPIVSGYFLLTLSLFTKMPLLLAINGNRAQRSLKHFSSSQLFLSSDKVKL